MSSGPKFFETRLGQVFFNGTIPRIAKSLEKIAEELVKINEREDNKLVKEFKIRNKK